MWERVGQMFTRQGRHRRSQGGQVLPVALAGLVLGITTLLLLGGIGNRVTEKSIAASAADAAAYSGGTWIAQHLNFIAYTNRAMIANHVGVGHFVAYMSWIRYVDDAADKIQDILKFIPFINAAAAALEQFADILRQLAELEGQVFVPAVDTLNQFYLAAQAEAHLNLGLPGGAGAQSDTSVDRLMQASATSFDPDVLINNRAAIDRLPADFERPLSLLLDLQNSRIVTFVRPREVTGRGGDFVELVEATFGRLPGDDGDLLDQAIDLLRPRGDMSSEWLNDREVNLPDFGILTINPIEKKFETGHTLRDDLALWTAEDELVVTPFFGKGAEISLASGAANSGEFDQNHLGISGWYDLTNPLPGHQVLPIIAYASKRPTSTPGTAAFGLALDDKPLSAIAIAHVEHRRPVEGYEPLTALAVPIPFLDDVDANGEYANTFNPFWRARIVGTHFSDLKKADPLSNLLGGFFVTEGIF